MLISNEKKVVNIGRVKYFLDMNNYSLSCKDEAFIVADDDMIDAMYDAYTQHIKLGRKEISFNDFCINYINGDYNYSIRQGWEKYE